MTRDQAPPRWRTGVAIAALSLLAATAAAAPMTARAALHFRIAHYEFDVADAGRAGGERSLQRRVQWEYPVFADTRDPATRALNAWIRLQAVRLLLGDSPLAAEAGRLTDRALVARAAVDRDFADSGIDQAVLRPAAALGRYRGIFGNLGGIGGAHPFHGTAYRLYDLDSRSERQVAELFKPDAEASLADLYDDQKSSDGHPCDFRGFGWGDAELAAVDALAFEYPYQPGQDVECEVVAVKGPAVTRLLKSPQRLRPDYELVEDTN